MPYREDVDALTARQAALQAELGKNQRELAEVTRLLVETRGGDPAEVERAPDPRRRRLHLLAGALAVTLFSSGAMAAVSSVKHDPRRTVTEAVQASIAKLQARHAARVQVQRLMAEIEALRALHLIPVIAPNAEERGVRLAAASRPAPAWVLGTAIPLRGSLWTGKKPDRASFAGEDER